ncbi:SUKH-3 domain-containing protein [Streptomyces sp. NRRL F-5135]|uniref:SUKH-3 domain-containing protein n=1 Tax=Streptomyces sp. NRRL F-5135 TaxID=1463858 RepID=UPI00131C272D|nr:SUKH-3 domain-containing protein [Streptomyces sp. NRRL F-5135]
MEIAIHGRGRFLAEASGWRPGRVVDVSGLVHEMNLVGFDVSAAARRFLETFWKVRIEHPPSIELNGREMFSWTEFDPARVCTERDARIAGRCAGVAGEPLCPLGIDGFHLTVYMSPSGKFFAGMDSSLFSYADRIDEFFAKLADGSRPQLVGNWEL